MRLLAIRRPPWVPREGDRWIMVTSLEEAAAALGKDPRRVFLTTGRMELAPFQSGAAAFLCGAQRRGALADELPPRVELITARGPFNFDDERALLDGA